MCVLKQCIQLIQYDLTCTSFEIAANKITPFFRDGLGIRESLKNKAIFDSQENQRNAPPNLRRWLTTSSHVIRITLHHKGLTFCHTLEFDISSNYRGKASVQCFIGVSNHTHLTKLAYPARLVYHLMNY